MIKTQLDRERFVMGDASAHVGILNCERLTERRHIHEWQVEPHYHEGLAQMFVFQRGGIDARIDIETFRLDEPSVLWLPPLVSHGFSYPKDTEGWVLTIPSADVARLTHGRSWLERWTGGAQVLPSSAAPEDARDCFEIAGKIEAEHRRQGDDRSVTLEALLLLLLIYFDRGLARAASGGERVPDQRQSLVNRFFALLDNHLQQTRSVTDYAGMLSVTPTHLSRSVKSVCGRTASEIIYDRIILIARRDLVFTDRSIAQISYDLQFSTPSYFTRFFTQKTQETPRAYRARMRKTPGKS